VEGHTHAIRNEDKQKKNVTMLFGLPKNYG
jgi:hypothetical protein